MVEIPSVTKHLPSNQTNIQSQPRMESNTIIIDEDDDDIWEDQTQVRVRKNPRITCQHFKQQSSVTDKDINEQRMEEMNPLRHIPSRSGNNYKQLSTQSLNPGRIRTHTNQTSLQRGSQHDTSGRNEWKPRGRQQGREVNNSITSGNRRAVVVGNFEVDDSSRLVDDSEWLDDEWMDNDEQYLITDETNTQNKLDHELESSTEITRTCDQSSTNKNGHRQSFNKPSHTGPLSSRIKGWNDFKTSSERQGSEESCLAGLSSSPSAAFDHRQDDSNR